MNRGIAAAQDGDRAAAEALRAWIGRHPPADTEPYVQLATAELRAGRPQDALETLGVVLQRSPVNALALANAGVALSALGRRSEAAQMLGRAVQRAPDVAANPYNLAAPPARHAPNVRSGRNRLPHEKTQ